MFKRKTVLVVGAGCSKEFNLPAGDGLKSLIADQLGQIARKRRDSDDFVFVSSRGADETLKHAIQLAGQSVGSSDWPIVAQSLAPGIHSAPSIDTYLHLHRDRPEVVGIGKIAIAREIIRAEEESWLGNDELDLPGIFRANGNQPLWLHQLVSHALIDTPRDDIGAIFSNLTIITFNYDRVIEHYLYHALRQVGLLTSAQARDALRKLTIIHPYGKVGRLPWQDDETGTEIPFGAFAPQLDSSLLMASGLRLRTFTETVEDEAIISGMHDAIREAQQIAFLGFSFLTQNMDLMSPANKSKTMAVYATRLYESDANAHLAAGLISKLIGVNAYPNGATPVQWQNSTAGQFFRDYGRTLVS